MEQESSKTSFALIRLTLDYINMRNLGITVRRITPNANQFLAWIIGSSIPERKCMIGKGGGWIHLFGCQQSVVSERRMYSHGQTAFEIVILIVISGSLQI